MTDISPAPDQFINIKHALKKELGFDNFNKKKYLLKKSNDTEGLYKAYHLLCNGGAHVWNESDKWIYYFLSHDVK
ncbi:MAG: hypothetical protein IPH04_11765 [Saprospirales bacterium]|nr:hypothetical protein [Saprospirales bacterium]